LTFEAAVPRVSREVVFTTHTPVPAGHDRFDARLVEEHIGPLREALGLSPDSLMGLGRENPTNSDELFCMTVLALRLSRRANAVSALHGEVSRAMWTGLYKGKPEDEISIGHITNGVHVLTWLVPQMFRLYDRHLGTDWHHRGSEAKIWLDIQTVDSAHPSQSTRQLTGRAIGSGAQAPWRAGPPRGGANRAALASRRGFDSLSPARGLRPPFCHLQTGQPDPDRHRTARFHGQRPESSRPVRV